MIDSRLFCTTHLAEKTRRCASGEVNKIALEAMLLGYFVQHLSDIGLVLKIEDRDSVKDLLRQNAPLCCKISREKYEEAYRLATVGQGTN